MLKRHALSSDVTALHRALDSAERALDLEPESADALATMGDVLRRLERYDEAIEVLYSRTKVKPRPSRCPSSTGRSLSPK